MERTRIGALSGLVVLVAFLWLLPVVGRAQAASGPPPLPPNTPRANEAPDVTRAVDCGSGQTIQEAVNNSNPGDTVLVSGSCSENVVVGVGRRNIVIDGQGTAMIDGPDPTAHTILIRGAGITIRRFSSISGGQDGVHITRGGDAIVASNTIENTNRFGIAVVQGSSARIVNNIIHDNPRHGILVEESASARVGFLSFEDTTPRPNTIQGNGGDGVNVNRSSSAIILSNTITGNHGNGVGIFRVSHADVGGNSIDANGTAGTPGPPPTPAVGDGIFVSENSGVNLGQTGIVFDGANSTSPATKNTVFGLHCAINSYARGTRGTLNGNTGATSFDATCINATSP